MWDCVGEDREWGVAFIDNGAYERRGKNVHRMLKRSKVVLAHDSQEVDNYNYPADWKDSRYIVTTKSCCDQAIDWKPPPNIKVYLNRVCDKFV